MKVYEIRLLDENGNQLASGFGKGSNAMEAAENSIETGATFINQNQPVGVVAINMDTGLSFKFKMAQAT